MAKGAGNDGAGEVRRVAGTGEIFDVKCGDAASGVNSCLPVGDHVVALAGGGHVIAAVEAQLDRTACVFCEESGGGGDDGRLAFLAAKPAAHTPHLALDLAGGNAQNASDVMLHFGWMLGGRMDEHIIVLAGDGVGDVGFEIEVVLPADDLLAGKDARCGGEALREISLGDGLRGLDVGLVVVGGFDIEDRRERLDVEFDFSRSLHRIGHCIGGDSANDAAAIIDDGFGKQRFVLEDWPDIIVARDIGGKNSFGNAFGCEGVCQINGFQFAMGNRGQDERGMQRAGKFGHVIDIGGTACDVFHGTVMGKALADEAALKRAHDAASKSITSTVSPESSAPRRKARLPATSER